MTTLYHFSEDPAIGRFVPRPVTVMPGRPPGMDWLNGPLVWAIDEWHSPMYLFPRDCPRILIWRRAGSTKEDSDRWFGHTSARMIACVERSWFARLCSTAIYRYDLPSDTFVDLDDAGMWVSRETVIAQAMHRLDDLPGQLDAAGVELRLMPSLLPLRDLWQTSLHVSGVRLRNAAGWGRPSRAGGP